MAKAKQSSGNLEQLRSVAQYFTMAAAVLYGIVWAINEVMGTPSASETGIANVLLVATMVGGITMGVLYSVHLAKNKK